MFLTTHSSVFEDTYATYNTTLKPDLKRDFDFYKSTEKYLFRNLRLRFLDLFTKAYSMNERDSES